MLYIMLMEMFIVFITRKLNVLDINAEGPEREKIHESSLVTLTLTQ